MTFNFSELISIVLLRKMTGPYLSILDNKKLFRFEPQMIFSLDETFSKTGASWFLINGFLKCEISRMIKTFLGGGGGQGL